MAATVHQAGDEISIRVCPQASLSLFAFASLMNGSKLFFNAGSRPKAFLKSISASASLRK